MENKAEYPGKVSLGATVIYVEHNVREVLDFYVAAFGLTLRYYDNNLRFGELETGTASSIMIASYEAGEFMVGKAFRRSPSERPEHVEIAFVTNDVAAAYERALAAGATSAQAPKTFPWGQTAAYVHAIEGTLIGLLTPPNQ